MSAIATSYIKLERYQEALAMSERALDFHQRVLPADHPSIGKGYEYAYMHC